MDAKHVGCRQIAKKVSHAQYGSTKVTRFYCSICCFGLVFIITSVIGGKIGSIALAGPLWQSILAAPTAEAAQPVQCCRLCP